MNLPILRLVKAEIDLILALIGLIPLIGGLFLLLVNILGFGAVLASQLEMKRQQWFRRKSLFNANASE